MNFKHVHAGTFGGKSVWVLPDETWYQIFFAEFTFQVRREDFLRSSRQAQARAPFRDEKSRDNLDQGRAGYGTANHWAEPVG